MNNRKKRAEVAQETLEVLEQGFYYNSQQQKIELKEVLQTSQNQSVLYTPNNFEEVFQQRNNILKTKDFTTYFEVKNTTTLNAVRQLVQEDLGKVVALNFASAKNPGGGFLGGSQAQEESLARASGLYPCLEQYMDSYYAINRSYNSCLYTDHLIYSPKVAVFRDDEDQFLDNYYQTSFITSPAVNAGAVHQNEKNNIQKIESKMLERIKQVLSVAVTHNYSVLVLGAWGCGVFKNNPQDIARYFRKHLKEEGLFENAFKRVVFAVLDTTKDERIITPFRKELL